MGDRMMLTRAVANLIDNGLKYGPAGTDVHCTLGSEDGAWLIGVEDTGAGIAPEQRTAATESFVQLESAHGAARGGFGLGRVRPRDGGAASRPDPDAQYGARLHGRASAAGASGAVMSRRGLPAPRCSRDPDVLVARRPAPAGVDFSTLIL